MHSALILSCTLTADESGYSLDLSKRFPLPSLPILSLALNSVELACAYEYVLRLLQFQRENLHYFC